MDQAKALEAVARLGTLQKAAQELHRGHSAILYSLKMLEEQTRLNLFNREGYRNTITREGEIVLKYCRQLLQTRQELEDVCTQIKGGWEPSLKLIYDEIIDFNFISGALFQLSKSKSPTEIRVLSAHLHEVEDLYAKERADIMVTIMPLQKLPSSSVQLKSIRMHLVAHSEHPLNKSTKRKISPSDLNSYTFITIKEAPGPLGLSTEQMKFDSYFIVNGFMAKKIAIMKRLGFGWLPDYLIQAELKKGSLRILKTELESTHVVYPKLYHRSEVGMGRATRELLRLLTD